MLRPGSQGGEKEKNNRGVPTACKALAPLDPRVRRGDWTRSTGSLWPAAFAAETADQPEPRPPPPRSKKRTAARRATPSLQRIICSDCSLPASRKTFYNNGVGDKRMSSGRGTFRAVTMTTEDAPFSSLRGRGGFSGSLMVSHAPRAFTCRARGTCTPCARECDGAPRRASLQEKSSHKHQGSFFSGGTRHRDY